MAECGRRQHMRKYICLPGMLHGISGLLYIWWFSQQLIYPQTDQTDTCGSMAPGIHAGAIRKIIYLPFFVSFAPDLLLLAGRDNFSQVNPVILPGIIKLRFISKSLLSQPVK